MCQVVIPRAGGYERLTFETRPEPTPAPDEVVIAAEAMGVNSAGRVVRMGLYASAQKYVVLDANGVSTLREIYRHLARPGKLVLCVADAHRALESGATVGKLVLVP